MQGVIRRHRPLSAQGLSRLGAGWEFARVVRGHFTELQRFHHAVPQFSVVEIADRQPEAVEEDSTLGFLLSMTGNAVNPDVSLFNARASCNDIVRGPGKRGYDTNAPQHLS
jgi:hypothetical protein